eukprot:TRINITY_DN2002_c0_g1_i6.p1 TRINITY_DN2002_c0_g1~~TRINITY_DN2002_c0_g1_i6.p1  ORF type:complete len:168 (-),score=22.09 TRINITY_DN2002_c0_g1_i6:200-703(-)
MGASMVCMCSDLANVSIAFNPFTSPVLNTSNPFQRLFLRYTIPPALHDICRIKIQSNIDFINKIKTADSEQKYDDDDETRPKILHVHWSSKSKEDYEQSMLVKGQQIQNFLDINDFENSPEMRSTSGVYFWFHDYDQHSLPRHLKSKNVLLRMLQAHLNVLNHQEKQ